MKWLSTMNIIQTQFQPKIDIGFLLYKHIFIELDVKFEDSCGLKKKSDDNSAFPYLFPKIFN